MNFDLIKPSVYMAMTKNHHNHVASGSPLGYMAVVARDLSDSNDIFNMDFVNLLDTTAPLITTFDMSGYDIENFSGT